MESEPPKIEEVVILDGRNAESRQNKSIKLLEAFSLTFGMIIGSGIFIGVGPTFDVFKSDSIGMVVVFWIIGGIVAMIGGLCYAELGSRIPESGGERAYFLVAFNKKFSISYVFLYIFIVKSITLAALAVTTGSYMSGIFFQDPSTFDLFTKIFAAITLFLCFLINCWSKKVANKASVIFTLLKMFALILVISIGIYSMATNKLPEWQTSFDVEGFDVVKFTLCLINLFWSYEGWNILGMVAGDMKNPVRDLPLAMFLGISFVMLFYVMAAVSYSATLGYGAVRVSETVALTLAVKVLKQAYFIIPILICCSTFGGTNGTFYASGSVIASAGFSGDLPLVFSMVHKTSRTPIIALIVELALSLIFISFKFQVLLNYAAFISWVIYLVSFCALLKLKLTSKNQPNLKIFRIPIIFIFPMILVCIFTVVMCFYLKPIGCGVFTAIIVVIFGFQFIPDDFTSIGIFIELHQKLIRTLIAKCNLVPAISNDVS